MRVYLDLLREVLEHGEPRHDRTGVGSRALFGRQIRLCLRDGFPLLTTKRLHVRSIVHELIMFLRSENSVHYLQKHGVHIWDAWADADGNLGPIYGCQWRNWRASDGRRIDQLADVIHTIRTAPHSRRLIVIAWNPGENDAMALPPCHVLFQFQVGSRGLSCLMYQRSADVFLGLPFNIGSYALLTHLVASICSLPVDELIVSLGDVHLYANHVDQARLQLSRDPHPRPAIELRPAPRSMDDLARFRFEHVHITGYTPEPAIRAPIAV